MFRLACAVGETVFRCCCNVLLMTLGTVLICAGLLRGQILVFSVGADVVSLVFFLALVYPGAVPCRVSRSVRTKMAVMLLMFMVGVTVAEAAMITVLTPTGSGEGQGWSALLLANSAK